MSATVQHAPIVSESAYVGGLDGLRAVAVAAVIVYHFAPKVLPAGFLGVDVFFVVSGFLISRLIVAEITGTGRVGLGRFWARRAQRLLPGLGTMTVVVLCAVAIDSSSVEKHDIRAQALGTIFYCANWVMIFAKGSYFASVGRPSPFLHMWSLAVEEQFYLLLPLVCFVARRPIARHPVRAAIVALLGAVASTVWMAVLVSPTGDPSRGYLGSDSHAMGLLVGVALGVLAGAGTPWEVMASWLRSNVVIARCAVAAGIASLVAIVASMRLVDDHTVALYRGGFLVFSLLCGVVLVVVVTMPAEPLARMLRAPWLVAIGLRSYSLYLWHWPVRVFVSPRPGFQGAALFGVRLVVSVVLAEISFRVIERPFRIGAVARAVGSRGAILYFGASVVAASLLVFTVTAPTALPPSTLVPVSATHTDGAHRSVPEPQVDLFGDSTALVLGYDGGRHATELHVSIGGDPGLGCGIVQLDYVSDGRVLPYPSECRGWPAKWNATVHRQPHATLALMTGAWDVLDHRSKNGVVRFGTPAWTNLETDSLRRALEILTTGGRTVHLFEVPCYGAGDANFPLPERSDPKRIAALNSIYNRLANELPRVEMVHWLALVCPDGHRVESLHGVRLWQPDDVHLSEAGAVVVWKWWLPQLHLLR